MTDRFGYGVPRAFACVVRTTEERLELLVFRHPSAGLRIPKGRIEPGEGPDEAACRELLEESGLSLDNPVLIGVIEEQFPHPDTGERIDETWHCFLFEPATEIPDSWRHHPEEEDLVFEYFWTPIDRSLESRLHPHFGSVVRILHSNTCLG